MLHIFPKIRTLVATGLFLGVLGASSVTGLINNNVAEAASNNCDKVNIVYCGLDDSNYISSFKNDYIKNVSGHKASPTINQDYTDLQTIYKWAGASATVVNGMNNTNTKVGTLYRDGRIVVDGTTVGTDAWVTARFTSGTGFTHIAGNVYARKTTTSFANASAKVIVYMQNNQMVFAVMTECGNAVKATPVKPATRVTTPPKAVPSTPAAPVTHVTPTPTPVVKTVATAPTPTELPNTGAGDMLGIFGGVSMAGASAHRILSKRRLSK